MGNPFGGTSEGKVAFPGQLSNIADLIGGNFPGAPGLLADLYAAGTAVPANDFFGVLANQWGPLLNAGFSGGDATRQLAAGLSQQGIAASQGLAGQAAGAAGQGASLLGLTPQFLDAANAFAGRINQGAGQFNPAFQNLQGAFAGANQTLQDALNPTSQNSLFQNALANQVLPQVRSAYAARGLGTSGIGAGAEVEATRDLSNQFAMRQQQERLGALGTLNSLAGTQGGLAGALGQLGVQSSQVPGTIFNQFMQGNNAALQGILGAQQAQGAPLGLASQGAQLFNAGLQMGPAQFQNLYQIARGPQTTGVNLLGGTAGTFSNPIFTAFGVPYQR